MVSMEQVGGMRVDYFILLNAIVDQLVDRHIAIVQVGESYSLYRSEKLGFDSLFPLFKRKDN